MNMNTRIRQSWHLKRSLFTSWLLVTLSLTPHGFLAQEAGNEEVFELSPFEVDANSMTGYYATETLSGTYLRTNMRSLANPVTVLTTEFLEDIGATSYEGAVDYLVSTGSYQGDTADFDGNNARTGTPYNSRGFRVTQLTQNFLASNIRQDNYNTEALTQSRGPNSLLFGLGSVGGSMNTSLKRGRFGSDFTDIELWFDDFGTHRGSLDYNNELVEGKLALRFAALYDDKRTFRDLQFRRRNSLYGNLTYQPFENTTIHFMGEWGRIDEINPRMYLMKDAITAYQLDGSVRNFNTNTLVWIANDPTIGLMNFKGKKQGAYPLINGNRVNNVSIVDPQLTPDVYFPLDTIPSGPTDTYDTDYFKYGVDLQQRLLQNTYLQFTYQYEENDNIDYRPVKRQNWHINIDPNPTLPNGDANPWFEVPYIESSPMFFDRHDEYTQYRANLTHKIDFTGIEPFSGFDLGEINLVGSWYYFDNKYWYLRPEEMTTIPFYNTGNNAGRLDLTEGFVMRRYYLNGPTPHYPDIPWFPIDQSAGGTGVPAAKTAWLNRLNPVHTISKTESLSFLGQWSLFRERLIFTGGWREDQLTDSVMNFVRDPVTRIFEGFETGTMGDPTNNKVQNTNKGVVLRPLEWLDLFYNESTNNVNAGVTAFDVFGNGIPDQTGEGKDYGFRLFLFDEKIIIKLNYYENQLQNKISNPLRDGDAVGIGMARDNGEIEDFLDAMEYNGLDSLIAGALHFEDYTGNGLWTDVENTASEGYELEVTANLTRNWRMSFNLTKLDTKVNETYVTFMPWYDQYIAPIADDATIRALPVNPEDANTSVTTIGHVIDRIDRKLQFHWSQVGGQTVRFGEWAWNLVTSYEFRNHKDDWLENVRAGAGIRWRDAPSLGFPEDDEGNFDTSRPFKGEEEFVTDVFLTKGWNIGRGASSYRVNATVRVRNLFNDDGWVPRTGVDDGAGNLFPLQQVFLSPRSYELQIQFRF